MDGGDDPYALLQVPISASPAEIRGAYRRLAQQHHPDRPGGSAERMAALNRAYAILGNPAARRQYDASRQPARPSPPPARPAPAEPEPAAWLEDLELGRDMEHWQQMYAEERRVWQELLRGQPSEDSRQQLQRALDQARQDQLALENAIRARRGELMLSLADLDRESSTEQQQREQAAHRVGCAAVAVLLVALRAASLVAISRWPGDRNPPPRAPRPG